MLQYLRNNLGCGDYSAQSRARDRASHLYKESPLGLVVKGLLQKVAPSAKGSRVDNFKIECQKTAGERIVIMLMSIL